MDPPPNASSPTTSSSATPSLLPYLVPFTALAFLLPLAGHRRRDVVFALILFWNIGFTGVVCWRLAALPRTGTAGRPN